MSYQDTIISLNSTELPFLQAFISALSEADSRISVDTTGLENNPREFTVTIAGDSSIRFVRNQSGMNQVSGSYIIYVQGSSSGTVFKFSSSSSAYFDGNLTRTWRFIVIANSESILLGLIDADNNKGNAIVLMRIEDDDANVITTVSIGANSTIKQRFKTSNGDPFYKKDRIPYINDANNADNIEIIKNKVFVLENANIKSFVANKIYDTSTIDPGVRLTIDNKDYYSLDEHTIMEI